VVSSLSFKSARKSITDISGAGDAQDNNCLSTLTGIMTSGPVAEKLINEMDASQKYLMSTPSFNKFFPNSMAFTGAIEEEAEEEVTYQR
jgi:hypothetical protein